MLCKIWSVNAFTIVEEMARKNKNILDPGEVQNSDNSSKFMKSRLLFSRSETWNLQNESCKAKEDVVSVLLQVLESRSRVRNGQLHMNGDLENNSLSTTHCTLGIKKKLVKILNRTFQSQLLIGRKTSERETKRALFTAVRTR